MTLKEKNRLRSSMLARFPRLVRQVESLKLKFKERGATIADLRRQLNNTKSRNTALEDRNAFLRTEVDTLQRLLNKERKRHLPND